MSLEFVPPGHGEPAGPCAQPRCAECGTIIDTGSVHPASRRDGRLEGRCPTHGTVVAVYGTREQVRRLQVVR